MSACNNAISCKDSFDQFKRIFGLLGMLKTVADEYPLADYSIFKQLKKLNDTNISGSSRYCNPPPDHVSFKSEHLLYVQRTAAVLGQEVSDCCHLWFFAEPCSRLI